MPASPAHVRRIANRMREMDVIETRAFGRSPKEALRLGLKASIDAFTVMIDGHPEAIMGMVPTNVIERTGQPWMLATDAVYGHPRAWLTLMPPVLRLWGDSTRHLTNLIGRRNDRAIRLLRRLGFEIGETVTVIGGVEFVTFSMVL